MKYNHSSFHTPARILAPIQQVEWQNSRRQICRKVIGPHRCFCGHTFQRHDEQTSTCLVSNCLCTSFFYVPFESLRCMCRHSYKDHDVKNRKCLKCGGRCLGFSSNWNCKCEQKYDSHRTVFKKKQNKTYLKHIQSRFILSRGHSGKIQRGNSGKNRDTSNEGFRKTRKKQALERINEKYRRVNLLESSFIPPTEEHNNINGLHLYMQPHYYRNIGYDKFMRK